MDGEDPLFGGETGRPMHSNRRVEGDRLEARTWSGPLPLPLLTPPNCPLYQTPRLVTRFLPTPRLVTEHRARVQRRRGPLPPPAGALQGELRTGAACAAQPSTCTAAICCACCPSTGAARPPPKGTLASPARKSYSMHKGSLPLRALGRFRPTVKTLCVLQSR